MGDTWRQPYLPLINCCEGVKDYKERSTTLASHIDSTREWRFRLNGVDNPDLTFNAFVPQLSISIVHRSTSLYLSLGESCTRWQDFSASGHYPAKIRCQNAQISENGAHNIHMNQ